MNHRKLLKLFLILLGSSLGAVGQTNDSRAQFIDSIRKNIVTDSVKERFRRGNSEAFAAYFKGGEVVKLNQSLLHVGVKSFTYYFLNHQLIMVHITHTQSALNDKQNKLVDTRYYLNKGKIIRKDILAGRRFGDLTSKQIFRDVAYIKSSLKSEK